MREVKARPEAAVRRLGDGTGCIVRLEVTVEREPILPEGQAIGKVEGAKARAGILSRIFHGIIRGVGAEEAF
jgi:hypothetical protein